MTNLEEVLQRLGWNDGFQIPISNAENKALEEELAKLSLRKAKAKSSLENTTERLDGIRDHFKFISQENEQNQKLITAHRQQLQALENQFQASKAEKSSLELEIKQTTKELCDAEEREEKKKCELEKGMAKAEKLKIEAEWDEEALNAWEEALRKRDEDNELIKKFSQEDVLKYNELEARRQKLQVERDKGKDIVDKMMSDMRNYEMVVERTGKVIKQQMAERDALIIQWKEAVKMMQQRDSDIVKAQELIVNTHEMVEKKKEKLQEENDFLKNEQKINRELESDIQNLNMINSKLRKDFIELNNHVSLLNGELQCLKRDVMSCAQHLENERIKGKQLDQMINNKEVMCNKYQEEVDKLNSKMEEMKGTNESSEDKLKRIERMIEAEEKQYNIYMTDTERLNMVLFLSDGTLKEQTRIGKKIQVDISNANCNCAHLRKHILMQTKELNKLKEVVYDMEFRIDDYEQKLVKLEAERRKDANSEEKEKHIQELEKILAEHKDVHHTLQNQVDRLEEEMQRLSNAIALDKEQQNILQDKCEQHLLVYEISKKHMAASKRATQEKQVEENMMRLRITQIEKDMKKEDKQIYTHEKLRLNLDQAMKERQLEINMKKMVLHTKKRSLEEDNGRLKSDIGMRRIKIDQLQKKYHIVLMALGKDEDGQPLSVTAIKIKNAQEKFMLQQEGDQLDQKIKTAEMEIVAMENALKLVNLTNCAFKNSLTPVTDEDDEVREMNELEEQLRETKTTLKQHKSTLATKQAELDVIMDKFKEVDEKRGDIKEIIANLEEDIQTVQRQEFDKADKLKRAECHLKRITKRLSSTDVSKYNRDFEIRQMRDANRHILQKLVEMATEYEEMAPLIYRYAMEQNVHLPEKKTTPSLSSTSRSSFTSSCSSKNKMTSNTAMTTARSQVSQTSVVNKIDLSFQI